MLGVLVLCALGLGIGVGVSGTTAKKPAFVGGMRSLSDHLVLDKTRVIAGQTVDGQVVIYNPGKTFVVDVCSPPAQVLLHRGNLHQEPVNNLMFCNDHLHILHGTTRLAITVNTTADACTQSGSNQPPFPMCLADGELPPLPPGEYLAKVEWGDPMPLPTPDEVALNLVAKTPTSVGPAVATPLASCVMHSLRTLVQVTEGSAEHWVIFVRFTNVSNVACTMMGSPHVAFINASGHQVGKSATSGGSGTKVTLPPGSSAQSGIWEWEAQVAIPDGFRCSTAHAAALRVEVPGQSSAAVIKGTGYAWQKAMVICANLAAQAEPVLLY